MSQIGGGYVEDVEQIIQLAKKLILEMGYHEPILFVKGTEKNLVLNFKEFGATSDERARQMLNAGANMAYKDNVGELEALVFVDEAWMGTNIDIQPSKDPKRIEVLVINTFDMATQEERLIVFEMVRDPKGKLIDLKKPDLPEPGSVKGMLLPAFRKGYQMISPVAN